MLGAEAAKRRQNVAHGVSLGSKAESNLSPRGSKERRAGPQMCQP
jgi:hypothetical protein